MSSSFIDVPTTERSCINADVNISPVGSWPSYFGPSVAKLISPSFSNATPAAFKKRFIKNNNNNHNLKNHNDLHVNEKQSLLDHSTDRTSSLAQATFNSINVLLGVGILSLPYALKCSGILIGMSLLILFSLITNYTGKLLGRCMEYEAGMKTYPDIGEAAFGFHGRLFISFIFFLELFTACTMFLILVGDNLHVLFPAVSETKLLLISFFVLLPTTWTSQLQILSYFSILGILSSVYLMVVLFYVGLTTSEKNVHGGSLLHPQRIAWIADSDRMALSIGLVMVGFAGHSVFPSIYSSMKDQSAYPRMLNGTYTIVFIAYSSMALAGYLMFGALTAKEMTINLMASQGGWVVIAVVWMVALNPATKFALTMNPVALSIEELLLPLDFMSQPSRRMTITRAAIRTTLSFLALCCALYVPDFARVTSFLGSLCAMLVSAIFPCLCYLKLCGSTLSRTEMIINVAIIIMSAIFGVIGTVAVFRSPE